MLNWIHFTSKTKVNLTFQPLSQSVASGMRCIVHLTTTFSKEAMYKSDFCTLFNNLLIAKFLIAKVTLYTYNIRYNNFNILQVFI